jgi:chorismate mutase
MDDTDLRGLSAADARAYVLEFITAMKSTERALMVMDQDLALWSKRVELAATKGAAELEAAARAKVDELATRRFALEAERADLAAKVARLKEQLPLALASERSVDTDLLLAQLQMATGEALGGPSPSLERELASLGTEDSLAALKRSLSSETLQGSDSGTRGSASPRTIDTANKDNT